MLATKNTTTPSCRHMGHNIKNVHKCPRHFEIRNLPLFIKKCGESLGRRINQFLWVIRRFHQAAFRFMRDLRREQGRREDTTLERPIFE
jgi:hypothetical protein